MRGILSGSPAPSSIRLLVGSELLLLIQAGLVLRSGQADGMLCALVLVIAVIALSALIAAVIGEADDPSPYHRRRSRHG